MPATGTRVTGGLTVRPPTKPKAGTLRFRHGSSARYDSDFSKTQTWVKISGKICSEFVDEGPELDEMYCNLTTIPTNETIDKASPASERSAVAPSGPSPSLSTRLPQRPSPGVHTQSLDHVLTWSSPSAYSETQLVSPVKRRRTNDSDAALSHTSAGDLFVSSLHQYGVSVSSDPNSVSVPGLDHSSSLESLLRAADLADNSVAFPPTSASAILSPTLNGARLSFADGGGLGDSPASVWPDVDLQEACLMRYWIDELACWFDLCDLERHFTLHVPLRAASCPALLNAIYTASARHLCRLSQYKDGTTGCVSYMGHQLPGLNSESAVEYHSKCIEHLLEASTTPSALYDENLLAASIILRFYEEVDAPFNGGDSVAASNLRGTQVFIDAQMALEGDEVTSLRRAAFRVACRQEVYMANIQQRGMNLPMQGDRVNEYRSLEPADDFTWAHRAVVHCADAIGFCFRSEENTATSGLGRQTRLAEYDALVEYHRGWSQCRPRSFDPIFWREAEGENAFPNWWFLSDCHVTGVQHLDLAKILLTVYDPRIPRLGPSQRAAQRRVESTVTATVRRLCGIALSNRRVPPAMNNACIGIAMCGDMFTESAEQRGLLEVLKFTDEYQGWPTDQIQERLKEAWGWA